MQQSGLEVIPQAEHSAERQTSEKVVIWQPCTFVLLGIDGTLSLANKYSDMACREARRGVYSKWRSRSSNALKPGTKAAEWWGRFASDGQGHGFIKLRPSCGNCPRDPVTLRKPFSLHLSLQTSSLRHAYNCLIPADTPLNFLLSQSINPLICLLPKTRLLERATLRRNSGALHNNFTCFRTIFPSLIIACHTRPI